MRNLARIEKIVEIFPHPNADRLDVAQIQGWKCIVKKGEFNVGDSAVYFEIDSFLPIDPRYEFLRKSCLKAMNGREGFRIKTIKLRGQLSQGLLLPLDQFPELINVSVGDDVAELLNVDKFDSEDVCAHISMGEHQKNKFPNFIRKTDQPRIQNLRRYQSLCKEEVFEATEKIDGSSMTVFYKNTEFGVCSRNFELQPECGHAFSSMAKKLDLEKILREINLNVAVQGELAGPEIQKNRLKLKELTFFIFDIFNINDQQYFTPIERSNFTDRLREYSDNGILLQHVPIIDTGIQIFKMDFDDIINFSIRNSLVTSSVYLEGIVYKSCNRIIHNDILSFKVINNEYLIEHGE